MSTFDIALFDAWLIVMCLLFIAMIILIDIQLDRIARALEKRP